jgi:hypothetical protein
MRRNILQLWLYSSPCVYTDKQEKINRQHTLSASNSHLFRECQHPSNPPLPPNHTHFLLWVLLYIHFITIYILNRKTYFNFNIAVLFLHTHFYMIKKNFVNLSNFNLCVMKHLRMAISEGRNMLCWHSWNKCELKVGSVCWRLIFSYWYLTSFIKSDQNVETVFASNWTDEKGLQWCCLLSVIWQWEQFERKL